MTPLRFTRRAFASSALFLTFAAAAFAADHGTIQKDDEAPIRLTHAATCAPRYDTVGFGKPELVVLLSDKPLDATAVRSGVDCDAHAFEQAVAKGDGALVSLSFGAGQKLSRVSVYGVGFTLGNDPCIGCKATAAYSGDRVRGSVATAAPLELSSSKIALNTQFDLPKPGAPAAGAPLPAGGGDPGKALLAWVKAYQEGDYETLERVLPPGKAAEDWGYYENEKERSEAIRQDASTEPKSMKILEGTLLGNFALLIVEVPPLWGDGKQRALVGLSLVDGSWRVDDLRRDLGGQMFKK